MTRIRVGVAVAAAVTLLTSACSTGTPRVGAGEESEAQGAESAARAFLASSKNTKHLSTAGHLSSRLQVESAVIEPIMKRAATRVAYAKRRCELERSKIEGERARMAKQIEEYRSRAAAAASTSDRRVATQKGESVARALAEMEQAWKVQISHGQGALRAAEDARDESANTLDIIARAGAMLPPDHSRNETRAAVRDVLERLTGKESVRSAPDLREAVADAIRECEREIAATDAEMERARTEALDATSKVLVPGDSEEQAAAEIAANKVAVAALTRVERASGRMRELETVRRQLDVLRELIGDGEQE